MCLCGFIGYQFRVHDNNVYFTFCFLIKHVSLINDNVIGTCSSLMFVCSSGVSPSTMSDDQKVLQVAWWEVTCLHRMMLCLWLTAAAASLRVEELLDSVILLNDHKQIACNCPVDPIQSQTGSQQNVVIFETLLA